MNADRDGAMIGTRSGDDLAALVHDAMCAGLPYRDRCRQAAEAVRRASFDPFAGAAIRLLLALDGETDLVKREMRKETIDAARALSTIVEPLATPAPAGGS